MKVLLEKDEYILVDDYIHENAINPFTSVSAQLIKVNFPIYGKSIVNFRPSDSRIVEFRTVLSHLVDISSSTEIDLDSLGEDIAKFCFNSGLKILVSTFCDTCDEKSLRFDIYDKDRKEIIKRGLTLEQLVDYVDEINKNYGATV